jgi:hypothetical protein
MPPFLSNMPSNRNIINTFKKLNFMPQERSKGIGGELIMSAFFNEKTIHFPW